MLLASYELEALTSTEARPLASAVADYGELAPPPSAINSAHASGNGCGAASRRRSGGSTRVNGPPASPRPYSLVLTKTDELFMRESTERRDAEADLRWLVATFD